MVSLNVYKKSFFTQVLLKLGLVLFLNISFAFGKTKLPQSKTINFIQNKKWTLVLQEADEIQREIVWLITQNRPLFNKSPFGKILRAKQQEQNIKLKDKSRHSCDQYKVVDQSIYMQVFEYCQKYRAPDILADVYLNSNTEIKVIFYGQNLSDVIGLSASIVSPKIECVLTVDSNMLLTKLVCENYKFSRQAQVVELKKMEFDRSHSPNINIEGTVLENMLPYSKLSVIVPEVGKIKIKEVKLRPDPDEIDPKLVKNKKPSIPPVKTPTPLQPNLQNQSLELSPAQNLENHPINTEGQGNPESIGPIPNVDTENDKSQYAPNGEKIFKQSEPEMIEMKDDRIKPLRTDQPYHR